MEAPLVLTREQVRRVDQVAIERYGMSGLVLMENAGRGVVDVLLEVDRDPGRVVILCGKGNNGGDGFVIARHLAIRGLRPVVALIGESGGLAGDALANWNILWHCEEVVHVDPPLRGGIRASERLGHMGGMGDVQIRELSGDASGLSAALDEVGAGAAWVVDALLGTGAAGEPREPIATAIRWMNAQAARRLAVDIPSGLDCDTGAAASATVRADVTCTFVAMKRGFVAPAAKAYSGKVRVVHIGIPPSLAREAAGV
jgi:NAD(P)H-hydrate epimerase